MSDYKELVASAQRDLEAIAHWKDSDGPATMSLGALASCALNTVHRLSYTIEALQSRIAELEAERIERASHTAFVESEVARIAVMWERGCYVLSQLMQAYERRIRSDCTTQEQIDKRPWMCAEMIEATGYMRAVWKPKAERDAFGKGGTSPPPSKRCNPASPLRMRC